MNLRFTSTRLLIASFLMMAQCSAPRTESSLQAFESTITQWPEDPAFTNSSTILAGFDAPTEGAEWQADHWILLGVKIQHEGQEDVSYVRISTLAAKPDADGGSDTLKPRKFTFPIGAGSVKAGSSYMTRVARVRVELFDRDGELLRSSIRMMPQSCPAASLQQICKDYETDPAASADAIVTLLTTLHPLATAKAMVPLHQAIRRHIVREPTIISFVLGGLRLHVDAAFTDSRPLRIPWSDALNLAPMHIVEAPVFAAGQHMFNCRMVVGPNGAPYHLTAGVLLFEATHPDKPANKLTVRVLAAQRGAQSPPQP